MFDVQGSMFPISVDQRISAVSGYAGFGGFAVLPLRVRGIIQLGCKSGFHGVVI